MQDRAWVISVRHGTPTTLGVRTKSPATKVCARAGASNTSRAATPTRKRTAPTGLKSLYIENIWRPPLELKSVGLAQIMCRTAISQLVCIAAFLGDELTGAKRFEWDKFGESGTVLGSESRAHPSRGKWTLRRLALGVKQNCSELSRPLLGDLQALHVGFPADVGGTKTKIAPDSCAEACPAMAAGAMIKHIKPTRPLQRIS